MSVAEPARVELCEHCGKRIAWSLSLAAWVHDATGERRCGALVVDGL